MSWLEGMRARLRLMFARRDAESRMEKEIHFHVEMETERLVREAGLDAAEARRQALVAFGGVEKYKEELRTDRGLAWLGAMSLDLKLGLRMLVKYPGLTVVGVLGMAVAVAIGVVSFGVIYTIVDPTLPLDDGDRIVAIQTINPRAADEGRTHLHDLATWREGLHAVEILGAYRTIDRNLITLEGRPEPARVAEMSASGFRIARVPPVLGRYFNDEDEREGAPPVVVIGHTVWQDRFAGQPDIVGRTVQLGATSHTVIGVMPEGFAFPINNRIWTPLRLDPSDFERGQAPQISVFGRLAPAASLEDAQTQSTIIGQRLAATWPEVYEDAQAQVLPYARSFLDSPQLVWVLHVIQLLISMLLVVIGTNVAVLVYARTATRIGEIAVRSALGASRGRIVAQLFTEALVLSAAAATVGLVAGWLALEQVDALVSRMGGEQLPFWMDIRGISPGLVVYVAILAVLGAVIVGVIPALRATRRDVHANLQQLSTAGSGMQLGKTWTVLIVMQVAVAVAAMPLVVAELGEWVSRGMLQPQFATKEFLTASLQLDREGVAPADRQAEQGEHTARYASLRAELIRRLEAEPRVSRVVLASAMPGDEPTVRIEAERALTRGEPDTVVGPGSAGYAVGVGRVDLGFFDAFEIPILTGRGFADGDLSAGATAVIVNRAFVTRVLRGGEPLGRRVRRVARRAGNASTETVPPGPWYEIVGVVPDFPNPVVDSGALEPTLYQPMIATASGASKRTVVRRFLEEMDTGGAGEERAAPVVIAVRVRGAEPASFADRLREVTVAVDPMLRLGRVNSLDDTLRESMAMDRIIFIAVALVTLSVLLLSAAGIYALMSFTITRRRREIGIRTALGAGARHVLGSVLSRAMVQIVIGIIIGISPWMAGLILQTVSGQPMSWRGGVALVATAALMGLVGLAAAIGPVRRALAIQPTEALRADG